MRSGHVCCNSEASCQRVHRSNAILMLQALDVTAETDGRSPQRTEYRPFGSGSALGQAWPAIGAVLLLLVILGGCWSGTGAGAAGGCSASATPSWSAAAAAGRAAAATPPR